MVQGERVGTPPAQEQIRVGFDRFLAGGHGPRWSERSSVVGASAVGSRGAMFDASGEARDERRCDGYT